MSANTLTPADARDVARDEARRVKARKIALALVGAVRDGVHIVLSAMLRASIDDDELWTQLAAEADAFIPSRETRLWIIAMIEVAEASHG